jgi:hypothetical protein
MAKGRASSAALSMIRATPCQGQGVLEVAGLQAAAPPPLVDVDELSVLVVDVVELVPLLAPPDCATA